LVSRFLLLLVVSTSLALAGVVPPIPLDGSPPGTLVRVPKDYPTIQAAVDQVQDGGEIRISKGTYNETVLIQERVGLRLVGKGKVVIDGGTNGSSLTVLNSPDIVLEKLTFANSTRHGLLADTARRLRVSRCQAVSNRSSGMAIDSSHDAVVERCRLEDNGAYGIRLVHSDRARIERNKVFRSGLDGISVSTGLALGADDFLVARNLIKEGARHGVTVQGFDGRVTQNRIFAVTADGVQVRVGAGQAVESATRVLVDRNRIKDPGNDGVWLGGLENSAVANQIIDAGGVGLRVRGGGQHLVERSRILRSGGPGLVCHPGGGGSSLWSNRIVRSGGSGVVVGATADEFKSNRISQSAHDGFEVLAASNTLRDNRCKGSGAFDLSDRVGGNTYAGNVFSTIDPDGVDPDA